MTIEKPILIIISGPSATGKTVLGQKISQKLNLPFITKDQIKELLFDNLGWSDREWSQKLGMASFELLWLFAEQNLSVGHSAIIETKFHNEFAKKHLEDLKAKYNFEIIQINCFADRKVLLKRFEERSRKDRHPGHCDSKNFTNQEFRKGLLEGNLDPIDIESKIIKVNTTDFAKINVAQIVKKIAAN